MTCSTHLMLQGAVSATAPDHIAAKRADDLPAILQELPELSGGYWHV